MVDSIAKDVIFSWEKNVVNGRPLPTKNLLMGHNPAYSGPVKNLSNWYKNQYRYNGSRKFWRRALKRARGLMDENAINNLLKRINVQA